jgi:hypothetical protein
MEVTRRPRRILEDFTMVLGAALNDDMLLVLLRRMLVKYAVMLEQLDLLLSRQVLIAEEDNAALVYEKSQFVELLVIELRQLGAF